MTCKWVAGYSVVETKGGLIRHLWSRGRDWCLCFESTAGKTKCISEKWQRSQGCTRRLTKALPCPWEEIRKSGPRKESISFQDSLPCPLRRKKITLSTYFDISDGTGFGKILLFLERTIKQNLQNNQRKTSGDASCSLFLKLLCCCEIEGGSVLILISVLDAAVDLLSYFVCKEVCPLCSAIRKTPFPQESNF